MTGRALYFTGPRSVEVRERAVPEPGPGEVRVRTERSAVSPGTELLVYRDEVPTDAAVDDTIDAFDGDFSYPMQYGYAAVGRVEALGPGVEESWDGERVFAFNPHESHFLAEPDALVRTGLPPEQGVFLPNTEAAVNFAMDARPRVGARVVVFGQGPVGLLTTAVLSEFPLAELVTVDTYGSRRARSESMGADRAVAPGDLDGALDDPPDLAFELSGNPEALDAAIDTVGYAGEVLVGSWYGTKPVSLDLGVRYHRSHVRVRSSQVSRVDPDHAGRWDKERRMAFVQSWLADRDLSGLRTHELDLGRAAEAYERLDTTPEETLQVVFTYD